MPRTFGDSVIHMSHCDAMVHHNTVLEETAPHTITEVEAKIGELIAENLVVDGATLQMGKSFWFNIDTWDVRTPIFLDSPVVFDWLIDWKILFLSMQGCHTFINSWRSI